VLVSILMVQHSMSARFNLEDDVHVNRNDHDEGLWENIPT